MQIRINDQTVKSRILSFWVVEKLYFLKKCKSRHMLHWWIFYITEISFDKTCLSAHKLKIENADMQI